MGTVKRLSPVMKKIVLTFLNGAPGHHALNHVEVE